MSEYTISNGIITLTAASHGGEIKSLKMNGDEYMWDANPRFWGRTAPVLFPFVGSVRDKKYTYNGISYDMGQHGFARDMEMELITHGEDELIFALTDSEETFEKYPFHFRLEITYRLNGSSVSVNWKVTNTGDDDMYFSIGGHPAFMCPIMERGSQQDYSICLKKNGQPVEGFECTPIVAGGLAGEKKNWYDIPGGRLQITHELFANDALIIENNQADEASLADINGHEYLTVKFEAPLFGLWSPAGKDAPFVCIEPWYGRCDGENFTGDLTQRTWGQSLKAGESFDGGFEIIL